ncbi:MAG: hypothetical protein AAF686_03860 [Pseudomonadota bacterium]
MIAFAAFILFAALLLAGALIVASTRRLSIGVLGLALAILGVSGICVLLGALWFALTLVALTYAGFALLYRALPTGLGGTGARRALTRRMGRRLTALMVGAIFLQVLLAVFGVTLLPQETPPEDLATNISDLNIGVIVLALPLIMVVLLARGTLGVRAGAGEKGRSISPAPRRAIGSSPRTFTQRRHTG